MSRPPDLSEFEALMSHPGPRCPIGIALSDLPPDRSEMLRHALDSRIQLTAVARWLQLEGHATSQTVKSLMRAVANHRSRECSCSRKSAAA